MTPAMLIMRTNKNKYVAIEDLNSSSIVNLSNTLLVHYKKSYPTRLLMQLGTIDFLGIKPYVSPTERKYGYDYVNSPKYQKASSLEQTKAEHEFKSEKYTNSIYLGRHDSGEAPQKFTISNLYQWCRKQTGINVFVLYQSHHWYVVDPLKESITEMSKYVKDVFREQAIQEADK